MAKSNHVFFHYISVTLLLFFFSRVISNEEDFVTFVREFLFVKDLPQVFKNPEMAKSLRSKWKRKMRAEKRVRYGEKEKIRLLNMLDAAKAAEENPIVRVTRVIRTREPEKEEGEDFQISDHLQEVSHKWRVKV